MKEIKHPPPFKIPQANFLDKAISFVSPKIGVSRFRNKIFMAMAGAYYGGSKKRRALQEWVVSLGDANADNSAELETLRVRSGDLVRNNPLACGAIKTKVTSVVGTGLRVKSTIDRAILGMGEDEADALEARIEAEWELFSGGTSCDVEDTLNFCEMQELTFRSTLERGDVFTLTPMKPSKDRVYSLQLQMIEADRVCNKDNQPDSETLSGGIVKSEYGGAPVEYHVLKGHPGNIYSKKNEWEVVKARGEKTGRRNILHHFHKIRIGQSRGVPDLAPVIEKLKQLGRYSDAELTNAVVSSFFTVFIKSDLPPMGPLGNLGLQKPVQDIGGRTSDKDFKLGSGAILDLAQGESIEFANPGRPQPHFGTFVLAVSREIGVALELPFEILVKHFTASYSAARAALLEAWKFYLSRRKWLVNSLCKPVYELFFIEAVALGRIPAPGFFSGDPLIKMAYLGTEWTGPAKGAIDETKEVIAAQKRVDGGFSTLDSETKAITGGDWEKNHRQRVREVSKRRNDGIDNAETTNKTGSNKDENLVPDQKSEEQKG